MANGQLLIYEINTIIWLNELSERYDKKIDLINIPESEIKNIADHHFNYIWLMGVWQRSPLGILINKQDHKFIDSLAGLVPDFNVDKDLVGSAYSIKDYAVSERLGGIKGLIQFRQVLKSYNIKLILDFVPNHTAIDHAWAIEHPEYYVLANETEYSKNPNHYKQINNHYIALGRDPNYEPWSDVLQLNAFSDDLRQAVISTINYIANLCDGIRCDMANLLLNNIFLSTWGYLNIGEAADEYWQVVISSLKATKPEFVFIAESYWQTENNLISLGFDYCYYKDFYDQLVANDLVGLRQSLSQPISQQAKGVYFLENHDEPRAVACLDAKYLKMDIVLLLTTPGAKLIYLHQMEGYKVKVPVQLGRNVKELADKQLANFYTKILNIVADNMTDVNHSWQLVSTNLDEDSRVLAYTIKNNNDNTISLVVINWADESFDISLDLETFASQQITGVNCLLDTNDDYSIEQITFTNKAIQLSVNPLMARILKINI